MSDEPSRIPLLGRLVEHGFGTGQAEVMATFALTALLDDDAVGPQFADWLGKRGGVELPDTMTYVPEARVTSGRIDVAGLEEDGWHVICEAKFGAELTTGQIDSYVADTPGARLLVLLVPETRRREAETLLALAAYPDRATLVVSWDELCDALTECGANECDVEQFHSLCNVATRDLQAQGEVTGIQPRMAPVESPDGLYYVNPRGQHIIHSQGTGPCRYVTGQELPKLVDDDAQAIAKVMVGIPLRAEDGRETRHGMFCMFCSSRSLNDEERSHVTADPAQDRKTWQWEASQKAGRLALGLPVDGSGDKAAIEAACEALRQVEAGESNGSDEQPSRSNPKW